MMTDWLFSWKSAVLGAILLIGAVAVGFAFRDSPLGNILSVVGFAVSVLGFVVTIWTVIDARQQITAAAYRAEKAVTQARDETRRAIRGIAAQLRAADCAALQHGLENLRQAAQDAQWTLAVYRCQECVKVAIRLRPDEYLTEEEKSGLAEAAVVLRQIYQFIERYRLPEKADKTKRLEPQKIKSLDEMIGLLARIQARLHQESLRSPTGASDSH
jgi:hypothetical protein